MAAPDLDAVVRHLLVEQRSNVLDKTKCSTSARLIYNYLGGRGGGGGADDVARNDNLVDTLPNLDQLPTDLGVEEQDAEPRVYYVHFDHLTNETSHYFILCRVRGRVLVLQSAVFEYNIYEWLHPSESRVALLGASPPCVEDEDDDPRTRIFMEQQARDRARQLAVYDSIEACRYSRRVTVPVAEFLADFLPKLRSLEGQWTEGDVERRCETYRELFACRLNVELVRAQVRLGGLKPASVKYIRRTMKMF